MNWLAHLFLSELTIDFQVGNILADPLKAKPWENSSKSLKNGMQTHLLIDSFSDKDEHFIKSKNRLKEKGILRGIVIDFTYDYLLSKNWDKFCNIEINEFKNRFYEQALKNKTYPLLAQNILKNIKEKRLLDFEKFENLEVALRRVDLRASEKLRLRDNALSYMPLIKNNFQDLEKDFLNFFPKLCFEVRKELEVKNLSHWRL